MKAGLFVLLIIPAGCVQAEPDANAIIGSESQSAIPASSLAGTSWRLLGYDSFESGAVRETPGKGEDFVITFAPDGMLKLQLACNSGTARWTADQREADRGSLDIMELQVTAMACPAGRMGDVAKDLEYVGSFVLAGDGRLVLNLRADSGNLVWEEVK